MIERADQPSRPWPALLALAGFALSLAVFYPGVMNYDARYVYLDGQKGFYGDWQSPVMTWIWKIIDPIAPGSASMFLLIAGALLARHRHAVAGAGAPLACAGRHAGRCSR